jgi:adenylylsulfate kinase
MADGVILADKIAIADFIAPTQAIRDHYDADYVIWMDTITEGRFEDTNALFEKPSDVDYVVTEKDALNQMVGIIEDIKLHYFFYDIKT